jgi:hypothetical protein
VCQGGAVDTRRHPRQHPGVKVNHRGGGIVAAQLTVQVENHLVHTRLLWWQGVGGGHCGCSSCVWWWWWWGGGGNELLTPDGTPANIQA